MIDYDFCAFIYNFVLKIQISNLNVSWKIGKDRANIRKKIKSNFDFVKMTNILEYFKIKNMTPSMRHRCVV